MKLTIWNNYNEFKYNDSIYRLVKYTKETGSKIRLTLATKRRSITEEKTMSDERRLQDIPQLSDYEDWAYNYFNGEALKDINIEKLLEDDTYEEGYEGVF